jgi:hypothetical protein
VFVFVLLYFNLQGTKTNLANALRYDQRMLHGLLGIQVVQCTVHMPSFLATVKKKDRK